MGIHDGMDVREGDLEIGGKAGRVDRYNGGAVSFTVRLDQVEMLLLNGEGIQDDGEGWLAAED